MSDTKMSDRFDLPLEAFDCYVMEKDEAGDYGIECLFNDDAKAIALAVNSHDKLVELLETMTDWVEYYDSDVKDIDASRALLQAIKGDQ